MSLLKENCPREQNIPECIRAILEAPVAWVKLPPVEEFRVPEGWISVVEVWGRPDGLFVTLSALGARILGVHLVEVSTEERANFRQEAVADVAWDLPTYDRDRDVVFLPAGTEAVYRWAPIGVDGPEPREAPERMPAAYVRKVQRAAANLRPARDDEPRRAKRRPTEAARRRMKAIRAV